MRAFGAVGAGAWGCEPGKKEGEKQMVGVVVAKMNEKGEGGVGRKNKNKMEVMNRVVQDGGLWCDTVRRREHPRELEIA